MITTAFTILSVLLTALVGFYVRRTYLQVRRIQELSQATDAALVGLVKKVNDTAAAVDAQLRQDSDLIAAALRTSLENGRTLTELKSGISAAREADKKSDKDLGI